jgi:hypothetical protein
MRRSLVLIVTLSALSGTVPTQAFQSQFWGPGWYVRHPTIVDIVEKGPFKTKAKCIAVAKRMQNRVVEPRRSKYRYYCSYLTGPI